MEVQREGENAYHSCLPNSTALGTVIADLQIRDCSLKHGGSTNYKPWGLNGLI